MQRILTLSLLATTIRYSYEIPVGQNADILEVTPDAGLDILSPGYESGHYPYQTKKLWELYALNAKKIQIVFEDIDIEFHKYCLWDSVRIFRSKCQQTISSSGGDAVLCGVLPTYKFDSESSPICIIFTSDWYVNKRGFKARVSALSDNQANSTLVSNTSPSSSTIDFNNVVHSTSSVSPQSTYVSNATSKSASNPPSSTLSFTQSSFSTLIQHISSSSSSSSSSKSSSSQSSTSTSLLSSLTTPTSSLHLTPSQSSMFASSFPLSSTTATTSEISSLPLLSSTLPSSASEILYSTSLSTLSPSKPILKSTLLSSLPNSFTSTPPLPTMSPLSSTLPLLHPSHSFKSSSSKIILTSSKTSPQHTLPVTTPVPQLMSVILCSVTFTNIDIEHFDEISILSPIDDTGLKYPPNKHCVFTIFNNQLKDVHLMFISFDMEYNPNCVWDYLEITLGTNQPIRYCGNNLPQLQDTQADKIQLVFHSDHIVHKKGLKMKLIKPFHHSTRKHSLVNDITSTTSSLETTLSFTETLTSHIHPTAQQIEATKSYTPDIEGSLEKKIDTASFSLTSSSPGSSSKSKTLFPSLSSVSASSYKILTTETPATILNTEETTSIIPTPVITTKTTTKAVSYQSIYTLISSSLSVDFSSTYSSFSESTSQLLTSSTLKIQETTHQPSTVKDTLAIVICEPNEISINVDNQQEVSIKTPQDEITGEYPADKHCVVTINNPQKLDISFELEKFDIEYHPVCARDYLLLKCDSDPEIRICGKETPFIPESIANRIDIEFRSDNNVSSTGFVLKMNVFKPFIQETSSVPKQEIIPTTPAASTTSLATSIYNSEATSTSSTVIPTYTSSTFGLSKSLLKSSALSTTPSLPTTTSLQASLIASTSTIVKSSSTLVTSSTTSFTSNLQTSLKPTSVGYKSNSSIQSTTQELSIVSSDIVTSLQSTFVPTSSTSPTITYAQTTSSVPASFTSQTSTSYKPSLPLSTSPTVSATTILEHLAPILNVDICDTHTAVDIDNYKSIIVHSPKDANGIYPLNKHCVLVINNLHIEDIYIEVLEFNIERNPSCSWDYLKLTNGDELPYVWCGNDIPNPMTTQEKKIEVVFHSDFMVSLKGFVMKLTKQSNLVTGKTTQSPGHTSASTNLTSTEGKTTEWPTSSNEDLIEEDQLPETPDNSGIAQTTANVTTIQHVETIGSSNQYQTTETSSEKNISEVETTSKAHTSAVTQDLTTEMSVAMSSISTPISESSQEQTTENVTTGINEKSSPTQSSTQELSSSSSTGADSDAPTPKSVATSGTVPTTQPSSEGKPDQPMSEVRETSNPSTHLSSEKSIQPSSSPIETTSTASTSTGSIASPDHACAAETMPSVMSGRFGLITSPGLGDNKYPPLSTCMWHIKSDENKITLIIFEEIDIESSPRCLFDKLTFYELNGDGSNNTLTQLCGNDVPSTLLSRKDLFVQFQSDSIQERAGFKFQFVKVEPEPGVSYICPPGEIPCMKDGSCIPIEWWCDGTNDCNDKTDELYCHKCNYDQLQCDNGGCLHMSNRCDGTPQCPYNTDEQACVSAPQENLDTNVQINMQGQWLPLCYSDVTEQVRDKLCQTSGYRSAEQMTGKYIQSQHAFAVVELESGHLTFNKSSVCKGHETVRLRCTGSDCGRKGKHVRKKRIIGGSVSNKGEWPWSVVLRSGNTPICGGSIIDNMWVLTAGHCVKDLVNNPQILSVIAGVSDINDVDRQLRYVSEVILHPDYFFIFNADIALLRLQQPLVIDDNTKTICLPWDRRQFSPADMCYVTGFGVSDMKNYYTTVMPKYLRHVKTKIVDLDKCKAIYSSRFSSSSNRERINDDMICAGYQSGGMDACRGDSGGGLMCKTSDDRWTLAAVVSWGDMCGSNNRPGVYTNVVSFIDWIANITDPNGVRNVICDFEDDGWCGYTDVSIGNYVWTRKPGDKYAKGTILYATKTSSANTKDVPMTASLLTPTFNTTGENCLTFSFMFSGNSNITLSVFGEKADEDLEANKTLLWRITSHYPAKDSWKSSEVTLPANYKQIRFESLSEHDGIVGLGLDNISMSEGQCQGLDFLSCSFNDGNMCNYEQYTGHNSKPWSFATSDVIGTTNSQQDLCIRAGGDIQTFGYPATSKLITPKLMNEFTSNPHCVTFQFKKLTQTANELMLSTYIDFGAQLINPVVFWSSENAETNKWLSVSTTIHHGVYNRIVFEVKRQYYSSEAIEVFMDDIRVTDGICVNGI